MTLASLLPHLAHHYTLNPNGDAKAEPEAKPTWQVINIHAQCPGWCTERHSSPVANMVRSLEVTSDAFTGSYSLFYTGGGR
jgi:hypothetical protein